MPLMMQVKAKRAVECFVYMFIERGENMHICDKYVLYKVKIYIYMHLYIKVFACVINSYD